MNARRTCPVEGCAARRCRGIVAGRLMCLDHWRMVPGDVRREVGRQWALYRRTSDRDERRGARGAYLAARAAAIRAVGRRVRGEDREEEPA